MAKIKSFEELRRLKQNLQKRYDSVKKSNKILVKIAMATCGIASGAKEVLDYLSGEFTKQGIDAVITKTGCMGYCYAEPTIEITLPGKEPVVFGYVNVAKAESILEKYIKKGEMVDGIIPANYEMIDIKKD